MKISIHPSLYIPVLLAATLLLVSCTASPELPEAALEALDQHWRSLPGYQGSDLDVLRAWQGELSADESISLPATMEVWCVEARPASSPDPTEKPEPLIWIVIREHQEAEWTSALLATMSSTWPYQACGTGP